MKKRLKYWFIRTIYKKQLIVFEFEPYKADMLGYKLLHGLYNDRYEYVGNGYWLKLN